MKWMLNVWFSIALFIFACVFSFIAEIYRYHFIIQIIFTISACLLVAGLGYIADLQSKNNNKKLSDLGKALLILFFLIYLCGIRTTGIFIKGSNSPSGRLRSASDQ